MNFLEELNPIQYQAVTHKQGPQMIVAGAGSGKTRVLTYRIAYLISQGVNPFEILALTFTNKAAREMSDRIEKIVGTVAKSIWMGTFHSIAVRILRQEGHLLGYPKDFSIYDSDDAKSLLKTIVKEKEYNAEYYKPNKLLGIISNCKNHCVTPAMYSKDSDLLIEDAKRGIPNFHIVYEEYYKRCFKAGAMDFDDLLLNLYLLLNNFLDVQNKYQHKFKYVLIDEYQDTNHLQYRIIKRLSAAHKNICVVGDDAQSIYGFRGATIQNILNFEKDYSDCKIYKLEQNYRSSKNIVEAASSVINKNKSRLDKKIWTSNEEGSKIIVQQCSTDNDEGMFVAQTIIKQKTNDNLSHKDFAVLYRTNSQSRSFEEALRRYNIPYKIRGGTSFYQRKEIKDLMAYLRLALNPKDEEAFKRIINYPTRGIGNTTLSKIEQLAEDNSISLWEASLEVTESTTQLLSIDERHKRPIAKFVEMIVEFQQLAQKADAYQVSLEIGKKSGILSLLYGDKTIEGKERYENLQELFNSIKEFVENTEKEETSLSAFVSEISLFTDADNENVNDDSVTLMTIHGAKGLEYPCVFIVGVEENLFPSQMSISSQADLEEERRLFYVALTRACSKAFISFALMRYKYGSLTQSEQSRFIREINPDYIEFLAPMGQFAKPMMEGSFSGGGYGSPKPIQKNNNPNPSNDLQIEGDDLNLLKLGDRVLHSRFGKGTVSAIDGAINDRKLTIDFDAFGSKQIIAKFAKMKILS